MKSQAVEKSYQNLSQTIKSLQNKNRDLVQSFGTRLEKIQTEMEKYKNEKSAETHEFKSKYAQILQK